MNQIKLLSILFLGVATAAQADLVVYDDLADKAYAFTVVKDENGVDQLTLLNCPSFQKITQTSQCGNEQSVFPVSDLKSFIHSTVLLGAKKNATFIPLTAADVQSYQLADATKNDPLLKDKYKQLNDLTTYLQKLKEMRVALPNSKTYQQKEAETVTSIASLGAEVSEMNASVKELPKIESVLADLSAGILVFLNTRKTGEPNSYAKSQMAGTLMNAVLSRIIAFAEKGELRYAGGELYSVQMGDGNTRSTLYDSVGQRQLGSYYPRFSKPLSVVYKNNVVLMNLGDDWMEVVSYPASDHVYLKAKKMVSLESAKVNANLLSIRARKKDGRSYEATVDLTNLGLTEKLNWVEVAAAPASSN